MDTRTCLLLVCATKKSTFSDRTTNLKKATMEIRLTKSSQTGSNKLYKCLINRFTTLYDQTWNLLGNSKPAKHRRAAPSSCATLFLFSRMPTSLVLVQLVHFLIDPPQHLKLSRHPLLRTSNQFLWTWVGGPNFPWRHAAQVERMNWPPKATKISTVAKCPLLIFVWPIPLEKQHARTTTQQCFHRHQEWHAY